MITENPYGIETRYGFKVIKIAYEDILLYPEEYDLLVLSAREYSYKPHAGTLIKSLNTVGVNVEQLATRAEIDWRKNQHVWLSGNVQEQKFQRIACIEFPKNPEAPVIQERLHALFAMITAAKYMGITIKSIVMPILGTNKQKISTDIMVKIIASEAEKGLEEIKSLQAVTVVERDNRRFQILSDSFNKLLKRKQDDLSLASLDAGAKKKIQQIIEDVSEIAIIRERSKEQRQRFSNVISQLKEINVYPLHNIRFQNRLLAELMAMDLCDYKGHPRWRKKTLMEQIDLLSQDCKFSAWTRSYWHIMRELGNESVHITEKHPNNDDMNILFRCAAEVVCAWRMVY